ncbi:hypothetical protein NBRC116495_05320 [Aurantivibrio plasticivorans]
MYLFCHIFDLITLDNHGVVFEKELIMQDYIEEILDIQCVDYDDEDEALDELVEV